MTTQERQSCCLLQMLLRVPSTEMLRRANTTGWATKIRPPEHVDTGNKAPPAAGCLTPRVLQVTAPGDESRPRVAHALSTCVDRTTICAVNGWGGEHQGSRKLFTYHCNHLSLSVHSRSVVLWPLESRRVLLNNNQVEAGSDPARLDSEKEKARDSRVT